MNITERLDALVADLQALPEVKAAAKDPARVGDLPGVWVHWTGVDLATLTDGWVKVDLVLMVAANELDEAIPALEVLFNAVVAEFGQPDGDVRTQATTIPDGPVAVPSLVLPYLIA